MARTNSPRTTRLLSEFLALHYPNFKTIQELHLYAPNPAVVAGAYGKVSPRFGATLLGYADAAVIAPQEIMLWEARDTLTGSAIGALITYSHLWPQSHEATLYPGYRTSIHLLVAQDRPALRSLTAQLGIDVQVYNPAWYQADIARVGNAPERSQEQIT